MAKSLQEEFWAGEFGDAYIDRNNAPNLIVSATALFAKVLARTDKVNSVCELGANIGRNLVALHGLLPDAALTGVEINQKAAEKLAKLPYVHAIQGSFYDLRPEDLGQHDLTFVSGVLIRHRSF